MASATADKLSRSFIRLGWVGFWVQIGLAIIPLGMLIYVFYSKSSGTRLALGFTDYLALAGLLILAFTAFWSFRYARTGLRIADPARRPSRLAITRMLWVGLWASCLGIATSLLLLLIEVVRLLILFLQAPQGGVPVIRTEAENRLGWVSAIDIVSLLAELCTLAGELVVLGFTLWLLFRLTHHAADYDAAAKVG